MAFYNTDYDVITVFNIGYLAMKNSYYLQSLNLNIPFKKNGLRNFPYYGREEHIQSSLYSYEFSAREK